MVQGRHRWYIVVRILIGVALLYFIAVPLSLRNCNLAICSFCSFVYHMLLWTVRSCPTPIIPRHIEIEDAACGIKQPNFLALWPLWDQRMGCSLHHVYLLNLHPLCDGFLKCIQLYQSRRLINLGDQSKFGAFISFICRLVAFDNCFASAPDFHLVDEGRSSPFTVARRQPKVIPGCYWQFLRHRASWAIFTRTVVQG